MSICSISSIVSIPEKCLYASVNDYEIREINKQKYTVNTNWFNWFYVLKLHHYQFNKMINLLWFDWIRISPFFFTNLKDFQVRSETGKSGMESGKTIQWIR